ncbi:hypothetical protein C100_06965 [Sphingobium sp. C100]|nr:hypothetical protein C100_06965 [Sphingobium sp. C100]
MNETEVYLRIDFTKQMISRNKFINTDEFERGLSLGAIF